MDHRTVLGSLYQILSLDVVEFLNEFFKEFLEVEIEKPLARAAEPGPFPRTPWTAPRS